MTRRVAVLAWAGWAVVIAMLAAHIGLLIASRQPLDGPLRLSATVAIFGSLGAIVAARRPRNTIGWLFLVDALLVAVVGVAGGYAIYGLTVPPEPLPGAAGTAWLWTWGWWVPLSFTATLPLLLFPDGRLPSRRWRPVAWASGFLVVVPAFLLAAAPGSYRAVVRVLAEPGVAAVGRRLLPSGEILSRTLPTTADAPFAIDALGPLVEPGLAAAFVAVGVLALASASSLVLRFARSRGDERQQMKWMAYAASLFAGWVAVGSAVEIPHRVDEMLLTAISLLAGGAVGVAVLRYRLYEIDRIISRTVSYALLSGALLGTYLVVVVSLQQVLRPVTGDSQLAVAGATLAVAGLFGPLRRRLQVVVDRRFNRQRYDARHAVEQFRHRMRDGVDLDQLGAELVEAVRATVEPSEVAVWLRMPPGLPGRPEARAR